MAANQFSTRQAAINDAKRFMREKFGNDVTFPDGDDGDPPALAPGPSDASGFRVVSPTGNVLAIYVVLSAGKGFTWEVVQQPSS